MQSKYFLVVVLILLFSCPHLAGFDTDSLMRSYRATVHDAPGPCLECAKDNKVQVFSRRDKMQDHLTKKHGYSKLEAKFTVGCKMTKKEGKSNSF